MAEKETDPKEVKKQELLAKYGVTPQQVEGWKKAYGEVESIVIKGKMYIYRGLSRLEWRQISERQLTSRLEAEEVTAEKCVLFPTDFALSSRAGAAGVPATVAELIMSLSGFGVTEEAMKL